MDPHWIPDAETRMQRRKRTQAKASDGVDTLSQLLEREQHLARELQVANEEAGRLLRDARAYATNRDAACEAMIKESTASLVTAHEARLEAELRSIAAQAAAEASRFDHDDTVLTKRLVSMVLEMIGATVPSQPGASR
jgi:vacuolar-type H+-ATPase subunit H